MIFKFCILPSINLKNAQNNSNNCFNTRTFFVLLFYSLIIRLQETTFGYYLGLFSIILYIIDDQNNLFIQNTDWFLFDNTLFVTFLFFVF
jgi:hypothetical protein